MKGLEKVFEMRKKKSQEPSSKISEINSHEVFYIPLQQKDLIQLDSLDSTETPK